MKIFLLEKFDQGRECSQSILMSRETPMSGNSLHIYLCQWKETHRVSMAGQDNVLPIRVQLRVIFLTVGFLYV